jgi:hypothetical protein
MRRELPRRLGAAALLLALALACGAGGSALAEQSGRAGVVVAFNAQISPNLLPRQHLMPVSIRLSGSLRATARRTAPRLNRIEFAFGTRGGLDVRGLAVCPRSRLRNATRRQALSRCRAALVGSGSLLTEVPLSAERPLLARAALLAFNGRDRGRPAVWVHAYSASPAVSFVLPFYLSRPRSGRYGVLMRSPVGRALGRRPRLRSFEVSLGRRYRSRGRWHSYLNARCQLPPRFRSLSVPLARATYRFAPAPTLTTTILRACRVSD